MGTNAKEQIVVRAFMTISNVDNENLAIQGPQGCM